MNVSVENGDRGTLFDADGVKLKGMIISANLDTGEVLEYVIDDSGKVVIEDNEAMMATKFYRAPLIFERHSVS